MTNLDELLALRGQDLAAVCAATGADSSSRHSVGSFASLTDLEAIDAANGMTIYVRGDDIVLLYAGENVLPAGLTHEQVAAAVGSEGEDLSSRQGKSALLHVVAAEGVAWSEDGGEVGWVELFPASDFDTYKSTLYRDPGAFVR